MDIRKQLNDFSSLVKAEGDVFSFNVKFKITDIDYLGDNQEELEAEDIHSALEDEISFVISTDDEIAYILSKKRLLKNLIKNKLTIVPIVRLPQ